MSAEPPDERSQPEIVFYDGNCGLCHRAVTFLLEADREGRAFVFAPLFGETFEREIAPEVRRTVPDSLVFLARDGTVHVRSSAVLAAMARLGGVHQALAFAARIVPRFVRDLVYDLIARVRHRFFSKPDDVCPLVPAALRSRFLP